MHLLTALALSAASPDGGASPTAAPAEVQALVEQREESERAHLRRLGIWAASNIVAGAGLLALARPETSPLAAPPVQLEGVAVQSIAWGAINGAIVLIGLFAPKGEPPLTREEALAKEDDLGKVLWVNVGLDAGYMMAGGTMIAAGAFGADPAVQWQSHGAGIVTQGAALLALDVIAVWDSDPREQALQALPPTAALAP